MKRRRVAGVAAIVVAMAAACGPSGRGGGAASATVGRAPIDPVAGADIGSTPAEVERARQGAIGQLEGFIAAHPGDQRFVPDALLRVGSLQLAAADAALDRADEATLATATAAAVTALARLVDDYPAYPRRDVALYLLGYARDQAGDAAGALAAYGAVASPSPYADEARFRVGELQFAAGALDLAVAAYAPLAARPGTKLTALARYKLAWSHYRRDAYPDALAAFQTVLDLGAADPLAASVQAEARQYIALTLTEHWVRDRADDPRAKAATTDAVTRVIAYLGDGASADRRAIAELAADALAEELRDAEAAVVYRRVVDVSTDAAARTRVGAKLARLAARGR